MKTLGMLLFLCGLAILAYGFSLDTSVPVDYVNGNLLGLPDRVHNIGLVSEKQNYLIFGLVLFILGIITVLAYDNKFATKSVKNKKVDNNEKVKKQPNVDAAISI